MLPLITVTATRPLRATLVTAALLLMFLSKAATALAANAQIVATRDNTIFRDAESNSAGASNGIFAGNNANQITSTRRGLIYFDLAILPSGSFIQSATVRLWLAQENTGVPALPVQLHRLLNAWGESSSQGTGGGGSGAPAQSGDATWLSRFFPTESWNTAGGDFIESESASTSVGGAQAFYHWSSSAITADVQGWVDAPNGNFGWITRGAETQARTAKRFDSRESGVVGQRPTVLVTFLRPGDADGDDAVNLDDFTTLAANFGLSETTFMQGDFSRDGTINLDDFTILAANFGQPAPAEPQRSVAVPEPSGAILAAALLLGGRRRILPFRADR